MDGQRFAGGNRVSYYYDFEICGEFLFSFIQKRSFFVNFWYLQFPGQSFFDPKKVILRKMPIFLAKEKTNFFQLMSLVKKWYKMFFSINFYSPSKSQNIPTNTLIGYLATPRMKVANKFNFFFAGFHEWISLYILQKKTIGFKCFFLHAEGRFDNPWKNFNSRPSSSCSLSEFYYDSFFHPHCGIPRNHIFLSFEN